MRQLEDLEMKVKRRRQKAAEGGREGRKGICNKGAKALRGPHS